MPSLAQVTWTHSDWLVYYIRAIVRISQDLHAMRVYTSKFIDLGLVQFTVCSEHKDESLLSLVTVRCRDHPSNIVLA